MPNRQICSYIDSNGFDPTMEFICRLELKLQTKVWRQLKLLAKADCALQPPLIKAFRLDRYRGFFELRIRIRQMIRIIFFVDSDGKIILLHGFVKKHDRATEQALETARARKLTLATGSAGTKNITIFQEKLG